MTHKLGDNGKIDCANGVTFRWMIGGGEEHPEVAGWFEYADGRIMSGSYGWWRTTDPEKARIAAEGVFAEQIAAAEA